MSARQIVAIYLFAQAASTAAWWGLLLSVPACMKWFQPASWPDHALLSFLLGDSLLLFCGSIVAAIAVLKREAWAAIAVWSLAAAAWYPALYCIGVSILTNEAWIASGMMVCLAGLTLAMATIQGNTSQTPAAIRVTSLSKTRALVWTFAQTFVFWSVFLFVLPNSIVELEHCFSRRAFSHSGQTVTAILLFGVASAAGLWSGVSMAIHGDGTPLPTAAAPRLVITGPYRYVRNPMASAGILQGIAVGWYLGSIAVIGYALAGAVVWHVFVRPAEEADLLERFGDEYRQYLHNVSLWIPRLASPESAETDA